MLVGLPGQTNRSMEKTMDKVIELKPPQIQPMLLAYKPWVRKYQIKMVNDGPLPDFFDRKNFRFFFMLFFPKLPKLLLDMKRCKSSTKLFFKKFVVKVNPDSIKILEYPNSLILIRILFKSKLPSFDKGNLHSLTFKLFKTLILLLSPLLKKIRVGFFLADFAIFESMGVFNFLSSMILVGEKLSSPGILHVNLELSLIIVFTLVFIQSC